jgi:two-component system NtrC family sensor kinase
MISAVADTQTAVEAMKLGAYDYVTKPFELDALSAKVEKALERKTLITENRDYRLRMAEEALRDSESRFEELVDLLPQTVFELNEAGRISFVNRHGFEAFGYTSKDVELGLEALEMIAPEDREKANANIVRRLAGEHAGVSEYRAQRKDGSTFPILLYSSPIVRGGGTAGLRGIIVDITALKKGEELIKHRLEIEEAISRISSRFVGTTDVNFAISASLYDMSVLTGANRSHLFLFREDGATMDGTHEWHAEGEGPRIDDLQAVASSEFYSWIGRLRKGEPTHVKDVSGLPPVALAGARKLGGPDVESMMLLPLTVGGEFDGLVALTDVSRAREWGDDDLQLLRVVAEVIGSALERKRAEEELQDYKEHLEELVAQRTAELESSHEQLLQSAKLAAIGELVSGVAHEVNNPLAAISLYSELLLDEVDDERASTHLQIISAQAERAIDIVENLLSFARKHEPKRSYVSINDSITSTAQLRAYDLNLDNVKVTLDLDPNLPMTMADFRQLQQVFLNLITNAEQALREADGKGAITVTTRRHDNAIQIDITDDGPGIPTARLGRIFEPFYTTKDVGKGTGLGLSICHGIVEEHSGRIRVESTEGTGTTFTIEIPIVPEDASDVSAPCETANDVPEVHSGAS